MPISYVQGDATLPIGSDNKLIMHICNNIGAWGAGFVLALANRYPIARKIYLNADEYPLGSVQFVLADDNVLIANMIAQNGVRGFSNPNPISYEALGNCLDLVFKQALAEGRSIHAPKIGSHLAGGDWNIISQMIEDRIEKYQVSCTIYKL